MERKARRVITHQNIDLDAGGSSWFWKRFVDPKVEIVFESAEWDGPMEHGDVALDIRAGGRGVKGELEDGVRHSCLAILARKYCTGCKLLALKPIVDFVDAQDSHGSAFKFLAPGLNTGIRETLTFTSLNAVLRAVQSIFPRDDRKSLERMFEIFDGLLANNNPRPVTDSAQQLVALAKDWIQTIRRYTAVACSFNELVTRSCSTDQMQALIPFGSYVSWCERGEVELALPEPAKSILESTSLLGVFRGLQVIHQNGSVLRERMFELFNGFLKNGLSRLAARKEAEDATIVDGRVAVVVNPRYHATSALLLEERGCDVVVCAHGNDLCIRRRDGVITRLDHPLIRAVVGDEEGWYFHEAGFMAARGGKKVGNAKTPSKVNPVELAQAVLEALRADEAQPVREVA